MGLVLSFISSIFLINWEVDRTNFWFIFFFYSLAFGSYILLLREKQFSFNHLLLIALGAQAVSMIYPPNLSEDYFRFLWDGKMTLLGINPFDFIPNEVVNRNFVDSAYLNEVYAGISDLSKRHYSCYPPVNQVYFIGANLFSESIAVNIAVMKLLIVLTELAGVFYLRKLFIHLKVDPKRLWLVYLNPLLIIECTGNVHFEGVMLSLLFISFYFLLTSRWILGAFIFALAIHIKLVPLVLLPFFLRYFPWKQAIGSYFVIGFSAIGLALTQINAGNLYHFLDSLRLYFQSFGFNSFTFHYINRFVKYFTHYNPLGYTGPVMSLIVMGMILYFAFKFKSTNWKRFTERMFFGFFLYLILGTTLHPWYVIPLLGLSVFTNYAFATVWSFLIFLSYFAYMEGHWHSASNRLIINIEYAILLVYLYREWIKRGSSFSFLRIDHYFQPKSES